MSADGVQTLRLPLSGRVFQIRSDGWWRELSPGQFDDESTGDAFPDRDEWVEPADYGVSGRYEHWPAGDGPAEGWWLIYDSGAPWLDVRLSDGRHPPIVAFGSVWICEWRSTWLLADVTTSNQSVSVFHRRPSYLR